jgi:hypothetical protein
MKRRRSLERRGEREKDEGREGDWHGARLSGGLFLVVSVSG